jgi:hypothetical protein
MNIQKGPSQVLHKCNSYYLLSRYLMANPLIVDLN